MSDDSDLVARVLAAEMLARVASTLPPAAFPEPNWWLRQGYCRHRQLPDGRWAAVHLLLYTTALVDGIDAQGSRRSWCYETHQEAIGALECWDGNDDPPGMWIKEKPGGRMNPRWLKAAHAELAADTAVSPAERDIRVRFRGREFVWLREADGGGALAYPEHLDQRGELNPSDALFSDSFAHVVDGVIWRHHEPIGVVAELEEVK